MSREAAAVMGEVVIGSCPGASIAIVAILIIAVSPTARNRFSKPTEARVREIRGLLLLADGTFRDAETAARVYDAPPRVA